MTKLSSMLENERRLRALTGLDRATFMALLPTFTRAMERYLTHYTLDGYLRESDRAITYANSPLPSPEDRLLFILTYLKQNAIQEAHGQMFAMSQSNVSKWVALLLTILDRALADQQVLPARTTAELAAQLQADDTPVDLEAPPFFCHDGTERPIARPKDNGLFETCRGKRMFFSLVLEHQKAMPQGGFLADSAEKPGELICAVLMR